MGTEETKQWKIRTSEELKKKKKQDELFSPGILQQLLSISSEQKLPKPLLRDSCACLVAVTKRQLLHKSG